MSSHAKKLSVVASLLKQERKRRAGNPAAPADFEPMILQEIESNLGRRLKPQERMTATLQGRHMFDVFDRVKRNGWQPAIPSPEVDLLDQAIADAKEKIAQERLAKATPAEQELALLQRAKADQIAKEMKAEQVAQEKQARAPMLARAKQMLEEFSDNVGYGFDAVDDAGRLVIALEHVGSDLDEITFLFQSVEQHRAGYVAKVRQELNDRIGELSSELLAFEREAGIEADVE